MKIREVLHYIVYDMPDDVVLVLAGLFTAIVFLWMNLNNVYSRWDVFYLIATVSGLIGFPMVYSIHYNYVRKRDFIISLLSWGGWYP